MKTTTSAALVVLAALLPSLADAQVTLTPANAPRWDTALTVGWLGGNKSGVAVDWNGWYDTATIEAIVGYHLNPHLKLELDVAAGADADVLVIEYSSPPGDVFPYQRPRDHRYRATSVSGGITYQFFENRWFHPFVGGGVAVVHETERAQRLLPSTYLRDPRDPLSRVLLPELPAIDTSRTGARSFGMFGFKAYASERVFFRTDVRVGVSTDRVESVTWRGGVGVDF